MLRSAAKNFESVTVVVDPTDYKVVLDDMKKNSGAVLRETNFKLCAKVYETTSNYDSMITSYLKEKLK